MIALLLAAATPVAAPVAADAPGIASFSVSPQLRRTTTAVTIGIYFFEKGTRQPRFWLRKTEPGKPLQWTDTLRCPAAADAIEAMRAIQTHPNPPPNDDLILTMDGVAYELDAPADFGPRTGRLRMTSNVGTPLAKWADATLTALAPCWSEEPPTRGRS